jgi:microcin C transport system substrate-binding protein
VLRHGWYLVPHFYAPTHRVAFRDTLAYPQTMPRFYAASSWLLKTWWAKPEAEKR